MRQLRCLHGHHFSESRLMDITPLHFRPLCQNLPKFVTGQKAGTDYGDTAQNRPLGRTRKIVLIVTSSKILIQIFQK